MYQFRQNWREIVKTASFSGKESAINYYLLILSAVVFYCKNSRTRLGLSLFECCEHTLYEVLPKSKWISTCVKRSFCFFITTCIGFLKYSLTNFVKNSLRCMQLRKIAKDWSLTLLWHKTCDRLFTTHLISLCVPIFLMENSFCY